MVDVGASAVFKCIVASTLATIGYYVSPESYGSQDGAVVTDFLTCARRPGYSVWTRVAANLGRPLPVHTADPVHVTMVAPKTAVTASALAGANSLYRVRKLPYGAARG